MLSRVANSLYWMSRYIERAENVARLLDVNLQLLLDYRNLDDERLRAHWMPIVQTTGDEQSFIERHQRATAAAVADFMVFNPDNPNSIVSSICQARENARMIRDQITTETWEELNRLYLFMLSPQAPALWQDRPTDFFNEIKAGSLQLLGLSYATHSHNEGWWFSEAGRFIERADKTSRILDLRHHTLPARGLPHAVSQTDALEWSAVLRSCSGWDVFKSLYGAEVNPRNVAQFLLLDEDFPRSIRFSVGRLNDALRRISGVSGNRFSNEAEKLCGRLAAELQFTTIEEVFAAGLHDYLDGIQLKLNRVGNALFQIYIFHPFEPAGPEQFVQQEQQQQQA
ncbi:MAG TPA: alpha-E domain-containing protein [Verrucomicrobiae bacterium]|nr:alpha-E domain-containing protein [Verrucomicrobiae bacterium]